MVLATGKHYGSMSKEGRHPSYAGTRPTVHVCVFSSYLIERPDAADPLLRYQGCRVER